MSNIPAGWKSLAHRDKCKQFVAEGKISQEFFDAQEQASQGRVLPARAVQVPKARKRS